MDEKETLLFPEESITQETASVYYTRAIQLTFLAVFWIIVDLPFVAFDIGPNIAPDIKLIDVIASVFCLTSLFAAAVHFILAICNSLIIGFKK